MSNTYLNPNNYAEGRNGLYMQAPYSSAYTSLSGSTSNPSAPQMVMNPNDAPYRTAISAFHRGLLNPNQNTPESLARNYYTINSAYGNTPSVTQISRSCTGEVDASLPVVPASVNVPRPTPTRGVPMPTRGVPMTTRGVPMPTRGAPLRRF